VNKINEISVCNEIKNLIFPYFLSSFEKIIIELILTNNFNRTSIKVQLKDGSIECISNHFDIPDDIDDKMFDLFKELKKQMKNKYDYWNSCFFFITKDNKYEVDFICNRRGTEDLDDQKLPPIIENKIRQINSQ
jgi:hypothetical protein